MGHDFCRFAVTCYHLFFKSSLEVRTNLIPVPSEGRNISIMTSAFGLHLNNQNGGGGGRCTESETRERCRLLLLLFGVLPLWKNSDETFSGQEQTALNRNV
ncbi:hypothetical protein ILYODFUR_014271 [Ilyodon furcidens]|uniref:Uncharacterized protein n=1 Tax=Ilyodon furcidens TaxID=33524 RepID=A0ABV0U5C0_9TELE